MKTKKAALVYNWTLTILVIFILIWALIQFHSKYNKFKVVGDKQYNLFRIYQKAESALFYIDQSAKYALQQAIYEMAQNGGFLGVASYEEIDRSGSTGESIGKKCGKFKDANVWYEIKKESSNKYKIVSCFDEESLITNLEYEFNKNLNEYLANYPDNIYAIYNYEIKNGIEIIGRAIEPLRFDILKDERITTLRTPTEIRLPTEAKDFVDFTGTELCSRGKRCLLTKDAYDLLLKAQEIAKQNRVSLEITYAYRTIEEQQILWKRNPDSKYVCPPSPNCPHLTGNVVDVKIKERTDWKLLHKIMTSVKNENGEIGWVRYSKEPWHFECCNTIRYAKAKEKGVTAIA